MDQFFLLLQVFDIFLRENESVTKRWTKDVVITNVFYLIVCSAQELRPCKTDIFFELAER